MKIIGSLELYDQNRIDHKLLAIDDADPRASSRLTTAHALASASDIVTLMPGFLERLISWLQFYKTVDGSPVNSLRNNIPSDPAVAAAIIAQGHEYWKGLVADSRKTTHWVKQWKSSDAKN